MSFIFGLGGRRSLGFEHDNVFGTYPLASHPFILDDEFIFFKDLIKVTDQRPTRTPLFFDTKHPSSTMVMFFKPTSGMIG